ncbi:MAG: glycine cleavage system protein GcvH [Rhabdochlamydiaceae bacterium]
MKKKYTETHEWVRGDSEQTALVGISNYARQELGEIVYVEMPKVGSLIEQGEQVSVLESTKAAADIYSPVSGKIIGINNILNKDLQPLNQQPEEEGWLFKIEISKKEELDHLLDEESYKHLIKNV